MLDNSPKLTDAIIAALISIGLAALGTKTGAALATVLNTGAILFFLMMLFTLWRLGVQTLGEHLDRQTNFADVFSRLDDEARIALSFQFPYMRYHMKRGIVRPYFADTQVPVEMFRLFLQTSNSTYISPQRDWYTKEMPEWAWREIVAWLEENDKIIPESAAGSHSLLWRGSAYQQLMAYWMAGRRLVATDESRAFAYETTTPPPLEGEEEG